MDEAYTSIGNKRQAKSVTQPKRKIPKKEAGFADKRDNQHEERRNRYIDSSLLIDICAAELIINFVCTLNHH